MQSPEFFTRSESSFLPGFLDRCDPDRFHLNDQPFDSEQLFEVFSLLAVLTHISLEDTYSSISNTRICNELGFSSDDYSIELAMILAKGINNHTDAFVSSYGMNFASLSLAWDPDATLVIFKPNGDYVRPPFFTCGKARRQWHL
jgi:hypothetical protein